MEQQDAIRIAKIAIERRWDFEQLKYSDYLYGIEDQADAVWELVKECDEIGRTAFFEKY